MSIALTRAFNISRHCSSDCSSVPQTVEASSDTSDMISKRQLLVDGDAEASNSAKINS